MLDQIKRIVQETLEALVPAKIMHGTVRRTVPLTVVVDNRLELSPPALVAPQVGHTHRYQAGEVEAETDMGTGATYREGERVILLRDQGGQTYVILGRG